MDQQTQSHFERSTVDGLLDGARELSRTNDLPTMLSIVVRAISEVADFECAAINLVTDDGDLKVVAVVGPDELGTVLLGQVGARDIWDRKLASAEPYGGVRMRLAHESGPDLPTWMSDDDAWFARTAGHPRAWRPEYAVYVPMVDGDGDLLGVVSVDMPTSGLIPEHAQLATLEVLSRQAQGAIVSAQTLARTALDEHIFSSIFEISGAAMCIADASGRITQTNRSFRDTFGDISDLVAFDALVAQVERAASLSEEVRRAFEEPPGERALVIGTGAPDDLSWFHVTVRGVAYTGSSPVRAVCTLADITGERRVRDRFQHNAEHDLLTGLYNRRGVREASLKVVETCVPDSFLVAMFCDLDGFKQANDRHGHRFGDQVLVEVATVLRAAAPEPAVIGRVGGDEFVIVTSCASIREAEKLADSVVQAIAVPIPGSGDAVVAASAGIAMDDSEPRRSVSDLMQAADEALYRAKVAGGRRWLSAPMR